MKPIRMNPAYRYGDMTPWGGEGLKTYYQREIPDVRTGESLEISAVPGLESTTEEGHTLPELLAKCGSQILGTKDDASKPFPLLLKLLAAKSNLSVQVHPDDAYAAAHENKLGKTEAWVILHAEPGASIVYGLKEGTTLESLKQALLNEEDIEPMLGKVQAHPGDVFAMPSGMVHAIGGGIVLYEIQQSSDVTYRLWDYNRANAKGEKRPLHIRQSIDVINPDLKGQVAHLPACGEAGKTILLKMEAFTLCCQCVQEEAALVAEPEHFRILTALEPLTLTVEGEVFPLAAGDTLLLPASCPGGTLTGTGRVLLAQP